MKTRFAILSGLLIVTLLIFSSAAMADAIDPVNSRPVVVGPPAGGEVSLQSILNGIFGVGVVNAATDQQTAGMWGVASYRPVISQHWLWSARGMPPGRTPHL